MTTGRKIRCAGPPAGPACNAYLGEVVGGKVRIYCARCKAHHEVYVTDLVEGMLAWLDGARPAPGNQFLDRLAAERKNGRDGG